MVVSTRSRTRLQVGVLVCALIVLAVVAGAVAIGVQVFDMQIYRAGARVWLDGGRLYDTLPLPPVYGDAQFTYPPVASVLFVPLAVLPWQAGASLLTAVGIASAAVCGLIAARSAVGPGGRFVVLGLVAVVVGVVLDPSRINLFFGQINLVLMVLVVADCLLPKTRWPRGLLIGIAAAIKLTPLAFIVFFLVRKQWRPALTAAGGFVAVGLLGFVLAPRDSVDYWLSALFDTSRVGLPDHVLNQSLRGVLAHAGMTGAAATVTWLALSLVVVVLGWVGVSRARRAGHDLAALLLVAVTVLLITPISWTHHWVWIIPALPMLFIMVRTHRNVLTLATFGLTIAIFLVGSVATTLNNGVLVESGLPVLGEFLNTPYPFVAVVALVVAVVVPYRSVPDGVPDFLANEVADPPRAEVGGGRG